MATASPPPPAPQSGERVLSYLRELREWCRRNMPVPGAGMTGRQTPDGRILNVIKELDYMFSDHPWKLYQKAENDPGLTVSMIPGIVTGTNASNSNPLNQIVTFADTAFPDDATTLVWVKVSIELIVWTPYFKVWAFSAAVVQTGASLPADTLDISTQTDGDVHVQIGSVTTASGAVTSIVQSLSTPLVYDMPPILYGPDTGIYVLVSEDGVIDWIEADPEPECPAPPPEE